MGHLWFSARSGTVPGAVGHNFPRISPPVAISRGFSGDRNAWRSPFGCIGACLRPRLAPFRVLRFAGRASDSGVALGVHWERLAAAGKWPYGTTRVAGPPRVALVSLHAGAAKVKMKIKIRNQVSLSRPLCPCSRRPRSKLAKTSVGKENSSGTRMNAFVDGRRCRRCAMMPLEHRENRGRWSRAQGRNHT